MKWGRRHLKISRKEIKEIIESRVTEFTDRNSKIEAWIDQNKASKIRKHRPKEVTECPVCHKFYTRNDWHAHRKFEMEVRAGSRYLSRDAEGKYKCPVQGC